jgi:hypothetical protein
MNRAGNFNLWIGGAALALLAAGGLMTLSTLRLMRERASTAVRVNGEFRALQSLSKRVARVESARQLVERTAATNAALPSVLLQSSLKDCRVDVVKEERQDAVPGWVVRRQRLAISDVAMEQLSPVLATIDAVRPPWRLHRLAAQASARGPGFARVEMVFETVERTGS